MALRYTHGYDLLWKAGLIFGGLALVIVGAGLLSPISGVIESELKGIHALTQLWTLLMWVYVIVGYLGAMWILARTILPYWVPTYLHVRRSLDTKITADEAKRLHFLFDGSLRGTWYPLDAIRKIDAEFRREALFRFANKISSERQGWKPFAMPEDSMDGQSTRSSGEQQTPQHRQTVACLQILGLREMPTSFDAIKVAYRRKIREFHPDKFAGERAEVLQYAEETSKRLNVAYAHLERHFSENMA